MADGRDRYLIARTGALLVGLEVDRVREVTEMVTGVRIPGTGPAVLGLVNLRGRPVALFDVARLLGEVESAGARVVVVVDVRGKVAALAVDEVVELADLNQAAGTGTLPGGVDPRVVLECRELGGQPVAILDLEVLLEPVLRRQG